MTPWSDMPSLAALRAFEAAARTGSYSAAARELNVTHAAVAQHVRGLETHFGVTLMRREGTGMAVTEAARGLEEAVRTGFATISDGVRSLAERDRLRPLRVAMTPSFATSWLMPRIGRFWAAHPEIRLELVPGAELVDLRRDRFDLAIRYGAGGWPGVESETLIAAGAVVVSAPPGPANVERLSDLKGQHWLVDTQSPETWLWTARAGVDLGTERVTELQTLQMMQEAARAGHGIAVMPQPIVARDLDRGDLVALISEKASQLAYHIVTLKGRVSPACRAFVSWLRREAAP